MQLLLRRGQSTEQIANTLMIDRAIVEERATAGLSALGGEHSQALGEDELRLLSAIVLGRPPGFDGDQLIDRSSSARAWLRSVRDELNAAGWTDAAGTPQIDRSSAPPAQPVPVSAPAAQRAGSAPESEELEPSRTGGALLLGLLAAALILGVLWLAGVFDTGASNDPSRAVTTEQTTAATGLRVLRQINLLPPNGSGDAKGAANVAEQDGERGVAVVASGLPASSFYALWIERDGAWKRLGFFPPVRGDGAQDAGRLSGMVNNPPADLLEYDQMAISREVVKNPTAPANVVLTGEIQQR